MQNKVLVILPRLHVRWCKAGVEEGRGRSGGVTWQRWAAGRRGEDQPEAQPTCHGGAQQLVAVLQAHGLTLARCKPK